MKPKGVLLISVTSIIGGGSEVVYSLVRGMLESKDVNWIGKDVVVVCPADGEYFLKMQQLGAIVYDLPIRELSWTVLFRLFNICKNHNISVIHSHGKGAGIYGRICGGLFNAFVIHSFHGFHYRHFRLIKKLSYLLIENILCFKTNAYIFVSHGERASFEQNCWFNIADKSFVIYNGVDVRRFKNRKAVRSDFGLSDTEFVVVTMARVSQQKGLETLVEAFGNLVSNRVRGQCFRLIIAGDDIPNESKYTSEIVYRENLNYLIKKLGLGTQIQLRPKSVDVLDLVALCDVYVSSSLGEGFSLALVEAMMLGLPVVATNVTGNSEAIEHMKSGLLVPSGDPLALADGLNLMVDDEGLRKLLGNEGRVRAQSVFCYSRMIEQTLNFYKFHV